MGIKGRMWFLTATAATTTGTLCVVSRKGLLLGVKRAASESWVFCLPAERPWHVIHSLSLSFPTHKRGSNMQLMAPCTPYIAIVMMVLTVVMITKMMMIPAA